MDVDENRGVNEDSHLVNQSENNSSDTPNLENHNAQIFASHCAEIDKHANEARSNIIPEISKKLYYKQYDKFNKWCENKQIAEVDEKTMLAYFQLLSETYKATMLWSIYSKLKATLRVKQKLDISKYIELQCFLTRLRKDHEPKKANVFTNEEVQEFLAEAPDELYLLHKVVLIFGLHGCLRKIELKDITINDVKQYGSIFQVFIPNTKTGVKKSFFTSEEFYPVINKYIQLRPDNMEHFFVQYRNQICTHQNVGAGKLGQIPKDIANFLELEEPDSYTGHTFRRTSATLIVDEGANIETLKRHGVWQSNTVAEGYINESARNKNQISSLMSSAINYNKREKPNVNIKSKVETITSGSLHNVKYTDKGLQAKKFIPHGAASIEPSYSNGSKSTNSLAHADSTHISLRKPNLSEYQYRQKVF